MSRPGQQQQQGQVGQLAPKRIDKYNSREKKPEGRSLDEAIGKMGLDGEMLGKCVIVGAKRNVDAIGWLNKARGVKSSDNGGMKPDRAPGEEKPDHGMMIFDDRRLNEVIGT